MKQGGDSLSVAQAFEKSTYILTLKVSGETYTIDNFEFSLWALQFGDWIWSELVKQPMTPDVVEAKRQEWTQTQALALRSR